MSYETMTKAQCQARTAAGNPCKFPAIRGAAFCWNHDPARASDRAQARKRGGQARHTPHAGNFETIPTDIQTVQAARGILLYTLAELLVMDNSIPRARALIALFEAFAHSIEIGEIEQRLAILEAATKR